jgi:hypothetical protein
MGSGQLLLPDPNVVLGVRLADMKRAGRIVLNGVTGLSLLVCAVTAVL